MFFYSPQRGAEGGGDWEWGAGKWNGFLPVLKMAPLPPGPGNCHRAARQRPTPQCWQQNSRVELGLAGHAWLTCRPCSRSPRARPGGGGGGIRAQPHKSEPERPGCEGRTAAQASQGRARPGPASLSKDLPFGRSPSLWLTPRNGATARSRALGNGEVFSQVSQGLTWV